MRTVAVFVSGAVLLAAIVGRAQSTEYVGKLTAIEKTRIQIELDSSLKPRQVWLAVSDDTPVVEGETKMTLAAAKLKKNTMVAVAFVPFEGSPAKEWSCTMHTHVAEAGPGKCPVCGMALAERDKAPAATEIRITKR